MKAKPSLASRAGKIVVRIAPAKFGYRNEFVQLLRLAQLASGMKPLDRARSGAPQ